MLAQNIFMVLESPLKKRIKEARNEINKMQVEYQKYFCGEEKRLPIEKRQALDNLITKLKRDVDKSMNSSDKFLMSNVYACYQSYRGKWDKKLRELELI